ncbi:MAG: hypothetical protein PHT43_05630, partial [Anaerolineaceae bacterium]|nr:hypothetical protein [Anaerolineaceae bacterium]
LFHHPDPSPFLPQVFQCKGKCMMKKRDTLDFSLYPVVLIIALLALIPFFFLLVLALKSQEGGLSSIRLIPDFNWSNFPSAWKAGDLGKAMVNSIIMTGGGIIVLISLSSMAGYTIARFPSALNKIIFGILLACMMIPGIINTNPVHTHPGHQHRQAGRSPEAQLQGKTQNQAEDGTGDGSRHQLRTHRAFYRPRVLPRQRQPG